MFGYLKKVGTFKEFVGAKPWRGLCFSFLTGVFLFIIESFTAFSIPLFLLNLGLIQGDNIPPLLQQLPRSLTFAVSCVFLCAFLRSVALGLYQYSGRYVQYSFMENQRKKIITLGIEQRSVMNSHDLLYLMNDIVTPLGIALQSLSTVVCFLTSMGILLALGVAYAPWESIVSIVLLVIFFIPLKYFNKKIEEQGRLSNTYSKNLMKSFTSGLKNFFLFKIYGLLDNVVKFSEKNILEYTRTHKSYIFLEIIKSNIPLVLGTLVLCMTTLFSYNYFDTPGAKIIAFFYIFC